MYVTLCLPNLSLVHVGSADFSALEFFNLHIYIKPENKKKMKYIFYEIAKNITQGLKSPGPNKANTLFFVQN